MNLELTLVFRKVPEGYIGFVEELPGAGRGLERAQSKRSAGIVVAVSVALILVLGYWLFLAGGRA